ncbi:MAG: hypothetical protein A2020_00530 [Lentisphaerae bacterium GWF2_45_14]|nr:MAG: hypothetical protein A2020_00530 [Lentisphaerae bacterium GWF2_45_14]
MGRSGTDGVVQHIFPGWALPEELYAPYEKMVELTIFHSAGFFSKCATRKIEDAFSLYTDEQCFITAHSMGSLFALKTAAASENVRALILFSPFARFTSSMSYDAQDYESIDAMRKHLNTNPEALIKSFWRKMAKPENFDIRIPAFLNVPTLREGLDILANSDMRDVLPEIRIPVLIFQGTGDLISTPVMTSFVKKNVPHAELVIIEGAGHALPFTRLDECMKKIKSFLSETFGK